MQHDIKVHPQFWEPLIKGDMKFQLRRNDRVYKVGDTLMLNEFNPEFGYTGKQRLSIVSYVLMPEDCPGLIAGFCILGLGPVL